MRIRVPPEPPFNFNIGNEHATGGQDVHTFRERGTVNCLHLGQYVVRFLKACWSIGVSHCREDDRNWSLYRTSTEHIVIVPKPGDASGTIVSMAGMMAILDELRMGNGTFFRLKGLPPTKAMMAIKRQ